MRRTVLALVGLVLVLLAVSCELLVLKAPRDEVVILAVAGPEGSGGENQPYWVNVVVARVGRTLNNVEVRVNGVELTYQEYTDDPDNGFFAGTVPDMSQGDTMHLEAEFPLIGLVERQLQIPFGIPEFSVDPALPDPGVPIDPDTGPGRYDVTFSSDAPSGAYTVAWIEAYDGDSNLATSHSSIPENGFTNFVGGPISDMNGNRYPYLAFSAQYFVYGIIEDWHPESGFLVYGSLAPWVTNLE